MKYKDRLAAKYGKRHGVLWFVLSSARVLFKFLSIPGLRDIHPWISYRKNRGAVLPINQELKQDNILLPLPVIDHFIDKSTHRTILDVCGCRRAFDCKNHPQDLGCIFIGDSSLDVSEGLGRRATKEEAKAHARKAISLGLVPSMGKVRIDNFFFSTPDRGKLLSMCFCCHCCCMGSFYKTLPLEHLEKMSPKIEGLSVEVTDDCTGCGSCMQYCLFGAISIENGKAVHSEFCRGCGRCATNCPQNAVKITLNNPDYADEVIKSISEYVDVS